MEVPPHLIETVKQGRAVLFLGAGASMGSTNDAGDSPPDGPRLAGLLQARFLGGTAGGMDLASVAEAAESETSLFEVQEFIREHFHGFKPAPFHHHVPRFRWRAIFTVNFDTVLEQAYDLSKPTRLQNPVVLLGNNDSFESALGRGSAAVPIVKLHGSITHARDDNIPFILTPDQYVRHRRGRDQLFRYLLTLAAEHTFVFVGHSLVDHDLRSALTEIQATTPNRPAYYFVAPDPHPAVQRMWSSKRVFPIPGTFEEFLTCLDDALPLAQRRLSMLLPIDHVVERRIRRHEDLSDSCRHFLKNHVDVVDSSMPVGTGDARAFYRGHDLGWYGIAQALDVRRSLVDRLTLDVVLRNDNDRQTRTELVVIKGFAGSGKTVVLRRIAWEASVEASALCVYLKEYGRLDYEVLVELLRLTEERLFLFIDNTADHVAVMEDLLQRARQDKLALTVVTTERPNEWNVVCEERLSPYVTATYDLNNPSRSEILALLSVLEQHDSLGFMNDMDAEHRLQHFEGVSKRQLLVALHEATLGRPFEDILVDEYNAIRPSQAKQIYLTVCVLNRLGVGVRAGVISRIYNIPFAQFEREFFKPLEHVVIAELHPTLGEMFYRARHEEIAQIVFERILDSRPDRFDEYVRILRALNVSYESDRRAYRRLLSHSTLREVFPNNDDVAALYAIAAEVAPDDAYRLQQHGIFEMKFGDDLASAGRWLREAQALEPRNTSIIHSLAEYARNRAEASDSPLDRERHRRDARALLSQLMMRVDHRAYARHTSIKIAMDELRELLRDENSSLESIDRAIQLVENQIQLGRQEVPGDDLLAQAEADLGDLLADGDRALRALRAGHTANPHNPILAIRLAKQHGRFGEFTEALRVIDKSLESNPHDKRLHFQAAMTKRELGTFAETEIIRHLQKALVAGDSNFEARFWLARYLFASSDMDVAERSRRLFAELRDARIPYEQRHRVRDTLRDAAGTPVEFTGRVSRKADDYGFIHVDALGEDVFMHVKDVRQGAWDSLRPGDAVRLQVGFNLGGSVSLAVHVQ